jgi:hypothetical protein
MVVVGAPVVFACISRALHVVIAKSIKWHVFAASSVTIAVVKGARNLIRTIF